MDVDAVEIRVVGCLIEKQRTTPDAYPLSLNALRVACNQSTNRDPVASYDEATAHARRVPAPAGRAAGRRYPVDHPRSRRLLRRGARQRRAAPPRPARLDPP